MSSRIWFSSDFHGYHKNICRGVSEWSGSNQGTRDFDTIEEMNYCILDGINGCCADNDEIFFLGDFTFAGIDKVFKFREQIRCKTIHYIYGNHCYNIRKNREGCQRLFTTLRDTWSGKIQGINFFLSHYPHLSWEHAGAGSIMIHGHEHGNINHMNEDCRRFDVGVDSAKMILGEYRPFSIEEVIEINLKKPVLKLGHHS